MSRNCPIGQDKSRLVSVRSCVSLTSLVLTFQSPGVVSYHQIHRWGSDAGCLDSPSGPTAAVPEESPEANASGPGTENWVPVGNVSRCVATTGPPRTLATPGRSQSPLSCLGSSQLSSRSAPSNWANQRFRSVDVTSWQGAGIHPEDCFSGMGLNLWLCGQQA